MGKYFIQGGAFMWPILILLAIGLVISLVKLFTLLLKKENAGAVVMDARKTLLSQGREAAVKKLKSEKPVSSVIRAAISHSRFGHDKAEKAVIDEGGLQSTYLDKGMVWLSLIVATAPMVGFLGTVVGMIEAMDAISQANDISPTVVASGISKALLTTAFGLIVAIIIQFFQNLFNNLIDARVLDMEETGISILETLVEIETEK